MYCNKCGNEISKNQKYCNKCGNRIFRNTQNNTKDEMNGFIQYNVNNSRKTNHENRIIIMTTIIIIFVIVVGIFIYLSKTDNKNNYYFNDELIEGNEQTATTQTNTNSTTTTTGKYKTAIITDNVYSGISVKNVEDANKLISQDSVNQKQSDYSKEIINIEDSIIQKYSITAVNLKEMDIEFAKELENVIKNIYTEYPSARGYLTNLTLTNLDMSEAGVIALFRPIFMFGTSNTNTTRPWVIKTQVELNAKYFLNPERISVAIDTSSKSGHFPKNATKYSPVAHEFGHYLSFIALLNHYNTESIVIVNDNQVQNYYNIFKDFGNGTFSKTMLEEAYENYKKDNADIDFDEWRGQISGYALAKNDSGEYIYDETIAEAFHDVYLNNENANKVSKYIVEVLKKYIEE